MKRPWISAAAVTGGWFALLFEHLGLRPWQALVLVVLLAAINFWGRFTWERDS